MRDSGGGGDITLRIWTNTARDTVFDAELIHQGLTLLTDSCELLLNGHQNVGNYLELDVLYVLICTRMVVGVLRFGRHVENGLVEL